MAPPLSVQGVRETLRWPRKNDLLLSLKAYLAVTLALFVGFSQNLDNPYWAGLTVYVALMQPSSGAIRSKSAFRLIGTIIGGLIALVLTALFADHLGIFLAVLIAVIGFASFLRSIDRTPTNYLWFLMGLTPGIVCLTNLQQPGQIFGYATARVAEISLGILAIAAVDSMFWPQKMLPEFIDTVADWRGKTREWLREALSRTDPSPPDAARRKELRDKLRGLTELIATLDTQSVLLPYDIVPVPPRRRDLNLGRRLVIEMIADLAAIEVWAQALRRSTGASDELKHLVQKVLDTIGEVENGDKDIGESARRSALQSELDDAAAALADRTGRHDLVERGLLQRLNSVLNGAGDLDVLVAAIRDGHLPPRRLAERRVSPARSVDYLAAARDALPMMVAMSVVGLFWYLTAWSGGTTALLFAFIGCMFLGGQPGLLRSAGGVTVWIGIAFALDFLYQFAVLPRVTAFPVLIGVVGVALIPLGLFFTMSMAGLLVCVFTFSLLGLQGSYSGNFQSSLLSMGGSFAGLLVATGTLYLLDYDRAGFVARRTIRAMRLDVADIATARRVPERARFLELTVDRLAQLFTLLDEEKRSDLLDRAHAIDALRAGANLLVLRNHEAVMPGALAADLADLRKQVGAAFRRSAQGEHDAGRLHEAVESVRRRVVATPDLAHRDAVLIALVGLAVAVDPDTRQRPADDDGPERKGNDDA